MSHLAIAIQRAAESRRLNQGQIGSRSGLSRSFISRLMSGDAPDLSDSNFTSLLGVFASSPATQAEIVAARCRDARVGPGSDLVEININGAPPPADETPHVPLSRDAEEAFAWLRSQCPLNPALERHIVGFAQILKSE